MKCLCILVFIGSAFAQSVQVWETDGDQSKLLTQRSSLNWTTGASSNPVAITVNPQLTYQQVDGFGASITDSAAAAITTGYPATAAQTNFLKTLFDPVSGIGLSFLRQPMGATDLSNSGNYSYDDQPDPQLTNFSIAHDLTAIVPLVQQSLAINPNAKVMLLPWSPPAWMKVSGTMDGGTFNDSYFPSLAQYFVKSIQAYQAAGIPIYAIAAQNEPLNSQGGYPTMYFTDVEEATFIGSYLGPAFASTNVKILGYEHNWDRPDYPEYLLNDPTASSYLAGSSFHCYGGDVSAQSTVQAAFPSKGIWFTECSGTVGSSFSGDLQWNAENLLIGATRNWARSVILWNLALDQTNGPIKGENGCQTCRGVVTIDNTVSPPNVTRNVEYYALGHLAKFVQPGAVRIDSPSFSGGIEDVAFQNPDGSVVLLVLNASGAPGSFGVNWSGQSFSDTLPAGALATYVWSNLQPSFPAIGVVNAANVSQPLSPGGIFSIYGTQMASVVSGAKHVPLTASFGSTSVTVNGIPAPLFYVSPSQINAQMPWEVVPGNATVTLTTGGQSTSQTVTVAAAGPAIFTSTGQQAIALNPDYSVNSQSQPAPSGTYVSLYGTGPGPVTPAASTGAAAPSSPLENAAGAVAKSGGAPLKVYFAGMAPGFVGALQVNLAVPTVTVPTQVPITLLIGGQQVNPITVWVAP